MELKGAEIRNLMELCNPMPKNGTENRKLNVLIPYYQRPYKWEETQIKNLFADYFKNEQKEYFVGSVVMVENHDGGFEIIDGQQRITTLFLLNYLKFIFLRAYIEELIIVKKVYKIDGYLSKLENTADNIFDEKIVDVCEYLADKGVRVMVAGLDKDFRGEAFGVMPELLTKGEFVTKLTAVCAKCGSPATRTQRLVDGKPASFDDPVVLVGAVDHYEPRCRHCHEVVNKPIKIKRRTKSSQ